MFLASGAVQIVMMPLVGRFGGKIDQRLLLGIGLAGVSASLWLNSHLTDKAGFEDAERDTLGNLKLGSVREVNGRRMTVGAFTWGLEPFGPSYAFVDYEAGRELMHTQSDQASYILVGVAPGRDPLDVKREIEARTSGVKVMSKAELASSIRNFVLFKQSLGASIGASVLFGVIVSAAFSEARRHGARVRPSRRRGG